jgi:hypothetical protein
MSTGEDDVLGEGDECGDTAWEESAAEEYEEDSEAAYE